MRDVGPTFVVDDRGGRRAVDWEFNAWGGLQVGLGLIVPVVLVLSVGMMLLGRMALAAQRQAPATGVGTLVGQRATVRTSLAPDASGMVEVRGELWQARSTVPIEVGGFVRITEVNGLSLTVVPDTTSVPQGDSAWKA